MTQLQNIMNLLTLAEPGGIERQEAQGVRQFITEETLPKEMFGIDRGQLTELGFMFGDDVDAIFVKCKFPEGWTKVATVDHRWCNLVDATGKVRGSVFYKAAFYDRKASLQWSSN